MSEGYYDISQDALLPLNVVPLDRMEPWTKFPVPTVIPPAMELLKGVTGDGSEVVALKARDHDFHVATKWSGGDLLGSVNTIILPMVRTIGEAIFEAENPGGFAIFIALSKKRAILGLVDV